MTSNSERAVAPQVLIVDDEEDSFMLLRRLLKRIGATEGCEWLRDGEAAVSYLQRLAAAAAPLPMLVLLDLRMPGMGGFDALRIIKDSPQLRDLLVVVVSSSALPEDVTRALKLGAFAYFEKYPTPEKFAHVYEIAKARLRTNAEADALISLGFSRTISK